MLVVLMLKARTLIVSPLTPQPELLPLPSPAEEAAATPDRPGTRWCVRVKLLAKYIHSNRPYRLYLYIYKYATHI